MVDKGDKASSQEFLDMQIGIHVSIAGSIDRAVDNAVAMDCNAFQLFARNPRGWSAPRLLKKDISNFKRKLTASKIEQFAVAVHMPYLPNFSSPEVVPFQRSMVSLIEEVKRCSKLGIPYLVAHLGSHKGAGQRKGVETVVKAFKKAAAETSDDVTILLENNAGHKHSVGSDFEEFAEIFSKLKHLGRFGVCFDTCHAFAVGYDLRTVKQAKETLKEFEELIGTENIKLIHLNDSKGPLGCNSDRHEHIGLGFIGEVGLAHFVKFAKAKKIPIILETPIDERRDDTGNIKKVRQMTLARR
ncbi:endonuclease 4 [uncultured archaeon]|nr:endonuclease 4 [uncultured archaeon]